MPATTKTWLKTLVPSVSDAELEAVTRQHAGDRIGALDALLTALWRQDGAQPATSPAIGGGGAKGRRRKRARPRETDAPADAADAGARNGSTTTRALRPEPSQRSDGSDAESDCIAGPSEAQQRGARAELRATPSAPSIAAAVAPALGFLRRAADSFKWETCPYLQLVQALHLRHSGELDARACGARAVAALRSRGQQPLTPLQQRERAALQSELCGSFSPIERDGPLVLASLALHGSMPTGGAAQSMMHAG